MSIPGELRLMNEYADAEALRLPFSLRSPRKEKGKAEGDARKVKKERKVSDD